MDFWAQYKMRYFPWFYSTSGGGQNVHGLPRGRAYRASEGTALRSMKSTAPCGHWAGRQHAPGPPSSGPSGSQNIPEGSQGQWERQECPGRNPPPLHRADSTEVGSQAAPGGVHEPPARRDEFVAQTPCIPCSGYSVPSVLGMAVSTEAEAIFKMRVYSWKQFRTMRTQAGRLPPDSRNAACC